MAARARTVLKDILHNPVVRRVSVQWGEMDAFQHVNNTVYFKYFEVARLAYFEELLNKVKEIDTSGSFDSDGFLRGRGVGPILAATSCSFKFPLTYPDEALLTSSIHVNDDVKETGFGMTYQVWSVRHKRLAAVGRGEVVAFNYGQGKAEPFPTIINEAIAALEEQNNLHLLPELEALNTFDA